MAPLNMTMTTITTAQPEDIIKNVMGNEKFEINKNSQNLISNISAFIGELKWFTIIIITTAHVVFVKEFITYPYSEHLDLFVYNIIYGYIGAFGLTAGAHRLWTHHSYKAKLPLRIMLMLGHSSTVTGTIYKWSRDHRVHHKYVDTDADPYNASRGFFFSHVGWLFVKKHPKVLEMGKQVDMSDILDDPVVQFEQKYSIPLTLGMGFILPSIIPPLLWGKPWYLSIITGCVIRWVILLNAIWSINSISHMFGNKPYNKSITARNNFWISLFTIGGSWHNFHHTFPWAYRFGRSGYLSDITGFCIDAFSLIGWTYDLKTPSLELIKKASIRAGDGSHPIWGAHMEIPESAEK